MVSSLTIKFFLNIEIFDPLDLRQLFQYSEQTQTFIAEEIFNVFLGRGGVRADIEARR